MLKKLEKTVKKTILMLLKNSKINKSRKSRFALDSSSRILAIRLNLIGDALVSSPLLKLIKENSGCTIDVLASERNKFAFEGNPYIDNIIVYRKGINKFRKLLKYLNKQQYDFIIDLHDDVSTTVSLIFALCDATYKFGLTKENNNLYTKTIQRLDATKFHVVERILKLSELFKIFPDNNSINIIYEPKEKSINTAREFLIQNFNNNKFTLGINLNAGSGARFWGTENFKKLIEYLKNYDLNLLLLTSPDKVELDKEISPETPIFYGSFDEYAAMISRTNMLFTPDTAAVHLASAFKIPVFGLYVKFNTNDEIWYPYKSDYEYVLTEKPTLEEVSFEQVIEKFIPFLKKYLS